MKKSVGLVPLTPALFKISGTEPRVGCGVVIIHKNKVLMCRRKSLVPDYDSKLHFFGGKIELGESMRSAAIREIKEELGIDLLSQAVPLQLVGVIEEISDDIIFNCPSTELIHQYHWVSSVWLAHVDSDFYENCEPEKHYDVGWYDIDVIAKSEDMLAPSAIKVLMESGLVAPF